MTVGKKRLRCRLRLHRWHVWYFQLRKQYMRTCKDCGKEQMDTPYGWSTTMIHSSKWEACEGL